MGWVYCLLFPNGKSYIGITTTSLSRRYSRHKGEARHGNRGSRLYKAWRKHGDPQLIALAQMPSEQLAEAERTLIAAFQTKIPLGYNVSDGGEGAYGVRVSAETRRRLSQSATGRRMSPEARERMALAKRGRPQTPEARAARSAGVKASWERRKAAL